MRVILLPAALLAMLLPAMAAAQFNENGSGLGDSLTPRALTPTETFMSRLKLDEKTQVPVAQQIIDAAVREAAPVSTELLQRRQALLNAEISKDAAAITQAKDAYGTAASRLASIQAQAFAKVYALLKPNQQTRAGDAFELLPVILAPGTPVRGGGMGRRGGGQ